MARARGRVIRTRQTLVSIRIRVRAPAAVAEASCARGGCREPCGPWEIWAACRGRTLKRFFQLECLGDQSRLREHVCVGHTPHGLGLKRYLMTEGASVRAFYPEDASVRLKAGQPGRVLTDFLSNTVCCFIANRRTREVVASVCGEEGVEYLPFVLFDHEGERYSDEYGFIHPLQVCDVVDREASEISYRDDDPAGEVLSVETYVFREAATEGLPPLFRVPECPYDIFLNEALARALHAAKITNLFLHEVTLR